MSLKFYKTHKEVMGGWGQDQVESGNYANDLFLYAHQGLSNSSKAANEFNVHLCEWQFTYASFLRLKFNPIRPEKPALKRSMVDGSGTGVRDEYPCALS